MVVTDEPALAFQGVRPEAAERAPIEATHYRADDIARELRTSTTGRWRRTRPAARCSWRASAPNGSAPACQR